MVGALLMTGCPIFPGGIAACDEDSDCARGFVCDIEAGECVLIPEPTDCKVPADCELGLTCGSDERCHRSPCDVVGCPAGWSCVAEDGVLVCRE